MLIAALFTIARTWKQPKSPLTGMDKDVIHIHNEIHLEMWMDLGLSYRVK